MNSGLPTAVPPADAGIRVLLVDDETSILSVVSLLLKRRGFVVDVAPDAQTARERARAERYDVALMDVRLRDTPGTELAAELERECGLEGRVALMTGGSRPSHYPCLLQPFDYEEMAHLLRTLATQGEAAPPAAELGSSRRVAAGCGCSCRSR